LNETYLKTKAELDEYKARVSKEVSDKMGELEMKNKILQDQLLKKDSEIKEVTNETISKSSQNSQELALLKQERDMLKVDLKDMKKKYEKRE